MLKSNVKANNIKVDPDLLAHNLLNFEYNIHGVKFINISIHYDSKFSYLSCIEYIKLTDWQMQFLTILLENKFKKRVYKSGCFLPLHSFVLIQTNMKTQTNVFNLNGGLRLQFNMIYRI